MLAFSWALLGFLPAQSTLLLLLDLLLGLSVCWGWLSMNAAGSVLLRVLAYLALAAFLSLYIVLLLLRVCRRWLCPQARSQQLVGLEEATLRAALSGSRERYHAAMADLVPGARGMYGRRHSTVLLSKAVRRIKTINEHPKLREILAEAVSSAGGLSIFTDDLERQFGTVKGIMDEYVQETDDPFLRESQPFPPHLFPSS